MTLKKLIFAATLATAFAPWGGIQAAVTQADAPSTFLDFDGSTQYMRIPHHADFNITPDESFTVTCWVKRTNITTNMRYVCKRTLTNATIKSGYELWGHTSSSQFFAVNSPNNDGNHNNSVSAYSTIAGYANEWHHVAFVIDRTAGKMYEYHNGTAVANTGTKDIAPWECTNLYDVIVGAGWDTENTPANYLNGSVGGLHFYKKALSADEINADATAVVSSTTDGLVAAYDFATITKNQVADISGHGHTGTLVGYIPAGAEIGSVTLTQISKFTGRSNAFEPILNAAVVLGGTDATVGLSSIKINLNGTSALSDISKVKVYKTTTATFDERAAAGATLLGEYGPAEGDITCAFTDATISSGTSYIWVCAEISGTAVEGNHVDAEFQAITTATETFDVSTPAPNGYREIMLKRKLVFAPGDYNSTNWRIPGILQLSDGSLLATTDKRKYNETDLPEDIDIVSRYSTDGGLTWSEPVTIAEGTGRKQGFGDAAIVEAANGDIVCAFVGGNGLWASTAADPISSYIAISHDKGRTWESRQDITSTIWGSTCGDTERSSFTHSFFGSGNGLRLTRGDHAGRIIFVAAMGSGSSLHNYAVYSDDNGLTWNVSTRAFSNGDEAKVVELNDGRVLMSVRQSGMRGYNISSDGGATWGTQGRWNDINTNACNGDIIRYTAGDQGFNKDRILHSTPNSASRENVSVFISYDEGETWPTVKSICPYNSVYSSLTILPDGTIGAYVEENPDGACSLYFMNFSLSWLTDGADTYTPAGEVLQQVEAPVITPDGGALNDGETASVAITSATDGAKIYYTTDGTVPTAESILYEAEILVDADMTIKAIATKDGMRDSKVTTAEFFYPQYCTPTFITNHDRYLTTVSVSGGTEAFTSSQVQPSTKPRSIYVDKTDEVITAVPGATLTPSTVWNFEWMHAYAYVDYDKNKEFNTTLNTSGFNNGELVSYTYYNGTNSLGATRSDGPEGANGPMPAFTLPTNLADGDYRFRLKIDWNSIDPCGNTENHIANNGGAIVDFTLRISKSSAVDNISDAQASTIFSGINGGIAVYGESCTARVYDMQGRTIAIENVSNGSVINLPAGLYNVRNEGKATKVIVK